VQNSNNSPVNYYISAPANHCSDVKEVINKFVLKEINENQDSLSGCLRCGAEIENFQYNDIRRVCEFRGKGLLTDGFFEVTSPNGIDINLYDEVLIQFNDSFEAVTVVAVGEMVHLKRKYLQLCQEELPIFQRKLSSEDKERLEKNYLDENKAKITFKEKVHKYNLIMKLVYVHYQFDRNKLYFFYTADGRVDFRELAKDLASEFKTRIELRQIGVRDEAKRIGGLATCGREFCCTSYLTNFKRI